MNTEEKMIIRGLASNDIIDMDNNGNMVPAQVNKNVKLSNDNSRKFFLKCEHNRLAKQKQKSIKKRKADKIARRNNRKNKKK